VDTRMTWRAALASPGGGRRSALRVTLATRSAMPLTAPRTAASTRSGTVAKLVSPSSAAKTAPLMRAAPQRPVRTVPLNHWTETRRRSTKPPVSPSTDNGGSLPRSIRSASKFERNAPCRLRRSKPDIPSAHAQGRLTATPKVPNATGTTGVDLKERHTPPPSRSVNDRVQIFWPNRWVPPYVADRVTSTQFHPPRNSPRSDTAHCPDKRDGGMWPQYGVVGPFQAG